MVAALRPYPSKVAVDTSDAPLAALAHQLDRAAPDLIKPNAEELASLAGVTAQSLESAVARGDTGPVVTAAQHLIDRGVGVVGAGGAPHGGPALTPAVAPTDAPQGKSIIAITACPTGIGHTYMAAVTIAEADAVIFATDVGVRDRRRFAGKPVIASGVKRAINEPDAMIAEAVAAADDPSAARVEGSVQVGGPPDVAASSLGWGTRLRQILLTGVSYMIPFVAAGGLLIALGFLLAGYEIANTPEG